MQELGDVGLRIPQLSLCLPLRVALPGSALVGLVDLTQGSLGSKDVGMGELALLGRERRPMFGGGVLLACALHGVACHRDAATLALLSHLLEDEKMLGLASCGQLGHSNTLYQLVPRQVAGLQGVCCVVGSYRHCVAVAQEGAAHGWGYGEDETLGLQLTEDQRTPLEYKELRLAVP